ncbi:MULTISPECIES: immunity 22 family protein [unclassified Bacillus (in: firmicutes)]|uniref:immunity 22 family protein n=1 Tax=unclassified Bacillus (in: firmicutes) TaxID=185979 RepID=UPI0008E093AE|nr:MULTISPECIES: immunity 22 family protein [unclassified Bacillus (in: firmicutes)]SFI69748.1 Immunity protein 22 [Bacillus sp. 71mf]SFS89768.1 Immunity protein 22 [Bacillus sp. 103mf]
MEYRGMVSLWIGTSQSFNHLEEYVDVEYTEDGDIIHSKFGVNFGFGYYDEDNMEVNFYEKPNTKIEDILKDSSYSEIIIPKFKDLMKKENIEYDINSVILLYDFQYDAEKEKDTSEDLEFIFIGAVPYN